MNNVTNQHDRKNAITAGSSIARAAGAGLVLSVLLGSPIQAAAQEFSVDLPAGLACTFDLRVEGTGAPNRVSRVLTDKNGNTVRIISAGQGLDVTYTNLQNGSSLLASPSGGSVIIETRNRDGTSTVRLSGHNGLILFPSDVPAGPTTTLYVGTVVYTVDQSGVFTLLSSSGKQVDICAALSG